MSAPATFLHQRVQTIVSILLILPALLILHAPAAAVIYPDQRGGDDVVIANVESPSNNDIAIDELGDIYVAEENFFSPTGMRVQVFRSQDGGDSFQLWGELSNIFDITYTYPSIVIAGGYCHLACVKSHSDHQPDSIILVSARTAEATAAWGPELEVMPGSGTTWYSHPDLATDAAGYQDYALFLTARSNRDTKETVWYTRSTDGGGTFEAPYYLDKYDSAAYRMLPPHITAGFGGLVHLVWTLAALDGSQDNIVFYSRCPNRGAGGHGAWDPVVTMASGTNGITEQEAFVGASPFDNDAQICYLRYQWDPGSQTSSLLGLGARYSGDAGATWGGEADISPSLDDLDGMVWSSFNSFTLTGYSGSTPGFQEASSDDPWSWDEPMAFADSLSSSSSFPPTAITADPSRDWRTAQVWSHNDGGAFGSDPLFFDAEWRNGPGYPNLMPGFPVALDAAPLSDPTVADLDGNGDSEIVFTDEANRINVYRHDGTPYPGWPLATGTPLAPGPVAIGDLNGDGVPTIFAGTADGRILGFNVPYAVYHPFPVSLFPADSVYVSIGALGGPYPRTLIATDGYKMAFLDYRGETPPGMIDWAFPMDELRFPVASGDIDGDGVAEVVVAGHTSVTAITPHVNLQLWIRDLGYVISGAPTLADIDRNGTIDVVVPTVDGRIFAMDGSGTDLPGFPVNTGSGAPLSSVALANITGSIEPELLAISSTGMLFAYDHAGAPMSGYPVTDPGYALRAMPAVMKVDNGAWSTIAGSDAANFWAWDPWGTVRPHFPYPLGGAASYSPACGDLQGVSRIQAVILTHDDPTLTALDFGSSSAYALWPMSGHDPRNTGCYGCYEDVVTAVNDGTGTGDTRVSFAAPSPNPSHGSTVFSFKLPTRAAARLEIFDVRGMRVRTVLREELEEGLHTVSWDGRDQRGQRPASGVYYARLRLRGPGLDRELTRKVIQLR